MFDLQELRQRLADRRAHSVPPGDEMLVSSTPNPTQSERLAVVLAAWEQSQGDHETIRWVAQRESDYFDGPGGDWPHELITYAACRDLLCYRMNKSERDMLASITARNPQGTR